MKFVALLLATLISAFCHAAELKTGGVVLLQPDFVLQERGLVVEDFANYIKAAQATSAATVQPTELPQSSGFLVLAVREGNKSNAWLDIQPALPATVEQSLIKSVRSIQPFYVSKGTVVFAIQIMVNGALPPTKKIPQPAAWKKAAANRTEPIEIENLVQVAWP